MYLSRSNAFSVVMAALVSLNLYNAYKVSHPKGKSYIYHINDDDYGKRLAANSNDEESSNGEEELSHDQREHRHNNARGSNEQLQPKYLKNNDHLEHNSESGNGNRNSEYTNYRSNNNHETTSHPQRIYNHEHMPNYNSKMYIDAPSKDNDSKDLYVKEFEKQFKMANTDRNSGKVNPAAEQYPSILPQITKMIFSQPSPPLQPDSPNNHVDQSVESHENHLSNSPSRSSQRSQQIQYSQRYVQNGPTATTSRTASNAVTEAPQVEKDYLSRPIYEFITPKPQPNYAPAKYETNIESPPATGAYPKLVSYSYSSAPPMVKTGESSGALSDLVMYQDNIHNGPPPPQTPSSPAASSEGQYEDGGNYDELYEMSTPPPKMNSPVPPPSSQSHSEHYYPPKYNPANSGKSGPDSFMTLSYEPSKEKDYTSKVAFAQSNSPAISHHGQDHLPQHHLSQPQSSPYYQQPQSNYNEPRQNNFNKNYGTQSQLSPPFYQTQSLSPLPAVNSIEDQQQPPRASKASQVESTYGQPVHQEPSSHYPHQYSQYQQQQSQQPTSGYVNTQEYPQNQVEQPQSEVLTYYRSYTNHPTELAQQQQQQSQQSQSQPGQNYRYSSPSHSQRPNYQAAPEQAQASEVEPVSKPDPSSDWNQDVQRYAKEFGFEVPSRPSPQMSQSPVENGRPKQSFKSSHLLSAPPESSKNNSQHYFNVIYPEFATTPDSNYRPTSFNHPHKSRERDHHHHHRHHHDQGPARPRVHHLTEPYYYKLPYLTSESVPPVNTDSEAKSTAPKVESSQKSVAVSDKSDGGKITKEEVDDILHKYNEVINSKKASASKPKQQEQQESFHSK